VLETVKPLPAVGSITERITYSRADAQGCVEEIVIRPALISSALRVRVNTSVYKPEATSPINPKPVWV
jgi:hypothetical protein